MDVVLDVFADGFVVAVAEGAVFFESEDEFLGVFVFFVGFAFEDEAEVVGEGQVADEAVLGVERDVGGFYLEEAVGVVEELDHVFADGGPTSPFYKWFCLCHILVLLPIYLAVCISTLCGQHSITLRYVRLYQ